MRRDITFSVAELHHRPRILLERAGFFDQIGRDHVFDQLEHALHAVALEAELHRIQTR